MLRSGAMTLECPHALVHLIPVIYFLHSVAVVVFVFIVDVLVVLVVFFSVRETLTF